MKKTSFEKQLIKTAIESVEAHVRGITRSRTVSVVADKIRVGLGGLVMCNLIVTDKDGKRVYANKEYSLDGLVTWIHSILQIKQA